MLYRLRRTLRRRERVFNIRRRQQEIAQQDLAASLHQEDELKRTRDGYLRLKARTREELVAAMGDRNAGVKSDDLLGRIRQMDALERLAARSDEDVIALQPEIQRKREEVLRRYKTRRAAEILASKTRDGVAVEELRADQKALDDLAGQLHRGRNGNGQ